ncbi:PIR protein CIR protein [Plasmodium vinckei petteri]|uniref:PIR protein CIR protein n=1 Tax=Plasmodium vinckei petteri TaxID=138298 RepID=A0A6V7TEQ8_PLAVN|nr:PIR protein CIR protein [Plasmodium vinckei petteri]
MDDQVCDFLREADNFFTRGTVDEKKFNKNSSLKKNCPYETKSNEHKCTTNNDRISAVSAYLHDKISEIDKSFKNGSNRDKRHIEIFMIWLGEKLFRIDNDYKATLEESYKRNLENSVGNVNYWKVTDSKQLYKKATIKKMSEYYNLLNYICKLITEYNKNPKSPNRQVLGRYSSQCDNFYKTIHKSINECGPYLQLLDSLKMIYENFRLYQMDINSSLKGKDKELLLKRVNHLTTFQKENRYLLGIHAILSFDDKECVKVKSKDEQIGEQILQNKPKDTGITKKFGKGPQTKFSPSAPQGKPKPPTAPRLRPQPHPQPKQQQASQQQASQSQPPIQKQTQPVAPVQSLDSPQKPGPPPTPPSASSQKDTKLKIPQAGEAHQNGPGGPGDGKKDVNSGLGSHGGSGTPVGTGDGQRSPNSGTGGSVNGKGSGQDSGKSSGQDGGKSEQGSTSSGARGGQKALDSSKGNKDGGTDDGANGRIGTPGSGVNGGGSTQGDQGNPSGGSNDPASNTLGGSFDLWSPFRGFLLNGTEIYNKTFQFIKDNQKMFKDAAEKINDTYNDTVENLKNVYNVSSSYFNGIINNITNQLNQVGTPPKLGGNQPGSGSPLSGGNSSNQSLSPPPKDPPPQTSPKDPQPQTPPINPSSPTPTLNHLPPAPTVNQPPPTPQQPQPLNPKQHKQSSSQSQNITQNPAQHDPPNHKANAQLVKLPIFNLNLKKPWNIFPTTWNGSGDCKPEIKFMNTTLVCCTSEQCSLTGILITLVLIPIILLIAYKYLSFGSSKKLEKKNMKRVINFHDGNRKTKIIISSNNRSKDLKPVINLVDGKKDSLLNIYKLIRADPMPFINLFFLLIFFAYKRKRDIIEL